MNRYMIDTSHSKSHFSIWDSVTKRLVGDGKGKVLLLSTIDETSEIIEVLRERIGA